MHTHRVEKEARSDECRMKKKICSLEYLLENTYKINNETLEFILDSTKHAKKVQVNVM